MQITITGPRAGGSTTLAIEIAKMLKSKGMLVDFRSMNGKAENRLYQELEKPPLDDKWTQSKVIIVEGLEREDEQAVQLRSYSNRPSNGENQ